MGTSNDSNEEFLWSRIDAGSAYRAITKLLTLDERLPFELARGALAELDHELFARLRALEHLSLVREPCAAPGQEQLVLWRNPLGKLYLRHIDDAPQVRQDEIATPTAIAYVAIPREILQSARAAVRDALAREQALRDVFDRLLEDIERSGGLQDLMRFVTDSVQHVEAVCFYVDGTYCGVLEGAVNLVGRAKGQGLLDRLTTLPPAQWSSGERLLVVALRALFLSGRSVRFEEFNGQELTARKLVERLGQFARVYGLALPPLDQHPEQLLTQAQRIGTAARETGATDYVRYRYICGLTYVKTERALSCSSVDDSLDGCSTRLARLYEHVMGSQLSASQSAKRALSALAEALLQREASQLPKLGGSPQAGSPIETLIEEIVASAVLATASDYGMSSSLREPARLVAPTFDARVEAALALKPNDFFTCVVGVDELALQFPEGASTRIFSAVQKRMQFNRWHFIAGNFERHAVPESRHFYYPPVLPDIAEWADGQHAGHTKAGVRFSIRSPGPDMHDDPLALGGHDYRGFYDIRVVRMHGPAYSTRELLTIRRHALWMGAVWRCIARHLVAAPVRIAGFQSGCGLLVPREERPRNPGDISSSSHSFEQARVSSP